MTKRIDIAAITPRIGSGYPPPYNEPVAKRERKALGDAAGLTQFGVNLLRLPPGVWSSQRHWHDNEDEMVFVVSGEVVLVTNDGEEILRAGDAAGFKAGEQNGHHLQNRSSADAIVLEIGTRQDVATAFYSEADLIAKRLADGSGLVTHRDGAPYP
jgi:uncharacterized cupin superfamily protein